MGIEKIIKQKLDNLFTPKSKNETVQEIIKRGYVGSKVETNKILFVGINPSYVNGAKPESYFYKVSDAIKEYPKHYKNFNALLLNTKYKGKWSYIDLFFFRETDQDKIDLMIRNEIMFIVEQLRLTNEIIKSINPKVIIIANSKSANFFGINKIENKKGELTNIWLGLNFEFDKNSGLMKVVGINDNSIIEQSDFTFYKDKLFLFTSTLTYMNKFEKERLSWLIDRL